MLLAHRFCWIHGRSFYGRHAAFPRFNPCLGPCKLEDLLNDRQSGNQIYSAVSITVMYYCYWASPKKKRVTQPLTYKNASREEEQILKVQFSVGGIQDGGNAADAPHGSIQRDALGQ
jgi:hypothetical protein